MPAGRVLLQLTPAQDFTPADGREMDVAAWRINQAIAGRVIAAFSAQQPPVIDYEHQTLHAEINGKPAPAAGWIGKLEAKGDGLYAVDVEWTAQAAEMIAARQYRYISPVFSYDKHTGRVLAIAHAALTNFAGLDGLTDLAAMSALAAKFSLVVQPEEEMPMKALLAALGLPETATEAEALAALSALKTAHTGELAALRGAMQTTPPDPAKYVEVATLTAVRGELATATTELAALKAEKAQAEIDKVIADGLAAGKLTPATEPHARKLVGDLASLKGFIDAQPAVVTPGKTQTGGNAGKGAGTSQLTDADMAVMKALGLTADQFAAGKLEA